MTQEEKIAALEEHVEWLIRIVTKVVAALPEDSHSNILQQGPEAVPVQEAGPNAAWLDWMNLQSR